MSYQNDAETLPPSSAPVALPAFQATTFPSGDVGSIVSFEESDFSLTSLAPSINIENSNDVVIGPLTQFHGPVTIYQNLNSTGVSIKHSVEDATKGKAKFVNEAKLIKSESVSSEKSLPIEKGRNPYQRIVMWSGIILFLLIVILSLGIVLSSRGSYQDDDDEVSGKTHPPEHSTLTTGVYETSTIGSHRLIYRDEWGGRPALNFTRPMHHPAEIVIISHTAGIFCNSFSKCSSVMQQIQSYHVANLGSPDIGYNFLIGGDENVYVGRDWDIRNFHMDGSVGISFIGNYVFDKLTPGMISAAKQLLEYGVELQKLSPKYKLLSHNATFSTESPGTNVYREIKTWPHFQPKMNP